MENGESSDKRGNESSISSLPYFRLYGHWSFYTFLICSALVLFSAFACTLAFGLIREQTSSFLQAAALSSGKEAQDNIHYGLLVLLALFPVVVIGTAVWLLDRWEPEPPVMYVITFLWGAGVSVLVAFYGNSVWEEKARLIARSKQEYDFLSVVLGAGLIEELVKATGLLVIFFALQKYVNGPMDGIVYGLLIGLGFAFTENILYFARASVAETFGGTVDLSGLETWTVGSIFFARAIVTPLIHPLATAITGVMVGAASLARKPYRAVWPLALLGWVLAATLHGFHNWSTLSGTITTTESRLFFQLPVYIGAIALIYYAAGLQRREVRKGLEDYRDAGWISSNEIAMVINMANRKRARKWAEERAMELGREYGEGALAMRAMHNELIQLGYSRTVNLRRGTVDNRRVRQVEEKRLRRLVELRRVFTQEVPHGTSI